MGSRDSCAFTRIREPILDRRREPEAESPKLARISAVGLRLSSALENRLSGNACGRARITHGHSDLHPLLLLALTQRELEDRRADHDLIAGAEHLTLCGHPVDVGAVARAAVLDLESAAAIVDERVTRLDRRILEEIDV